MKETENLKLKKPDPEDFYNVGDFNGNMDALDADQARQDEAISQAQQQLDAARQALAQAAQRLATAEQAIAGHTTAIQGHAGNATIHVTQAEKDGWNGKVPSTRKVNGKALSEDIRLAASDVGALGKTETAAAATKLATSRTIRTNLASTSSSSFNGTANITPGVTGILPVANGGTGSSTGKYLKLSGGTLTGGLSLGGHTLNGIPSFTRRVGGSFDSAATILDLESQVFFATWRHDGTRTYSANTEYTISFNHEVDTIYFTPLLSDQTQIHIGDRFTFMWLSIYKTTAVVSGIPYELEIVSEPNNHVYVVKKTNMNIDARFFSSSYQNYSTLIHGIAIRMDHPIIS